MEELPWSAATESSLASRGAGGSRVGLEGVQGGTGKLLPLALGVLLVVIRLRVHCVSCSLQPVGLEALSAM